MRGSIVTRIRNAGRPDLDPLLRVLRALLTDGAGRPLVVEGFQTPRLLPQPGGFEGLRLGCECLKPSQPSVIKELSGTGA